MQSISCLHNMIVGGKVPTVEIQRCFAMISISHPPKLDSCMQIHVIPLSSVSPPVECFVQDRALPLSHCLLGVVGWERMEVENGYSSATCSSDNPQTGNSPTINGST
jgi:hypothetical protein